MSVYVSAEVWRHGPRERNQRMVLLAIADNSTDDGFAYPLIATLADKCVMSSRNILRILKLLVDGGWMTVKTSPRDTRANAYQLNMAMLSGDKLTPIPPKTAKPIHGATVTYIGDKRPRTIRKNVIRTSKYKNKDSPPEAENHSVPDLEPRKEDDLSGAAKIRPTQAEEDEALGKVFVHYLEKTGKNPATYLLTPARKAKARTRLRECIALTDTIEDAAYLMTLAINNLCKTPWNCGDNPQKKKYLDWIDHLFKSFECMEKRYAG